MTETKNIKGSEKLPSLELIRFTAAIAVLVWHYQHLAFVKLEPVNYVMSEQPLYKILFPFYRTGFVGVQLFWCLSGYIFFWKYSEKIMEHTISMKKFFILRFSRLYPLHIATLIIIAILQQVYFRQHNGFFVFPYNDVKHFILQLFLAANWGLETGPSFNWPIWSVSVEVVIYFLFFLLIWHWGLNFWKCIIVVAVAGAVYFTTDNQIAACALYFFIGGLIVIIQREYKQKYHLTTMAIFASLFIFSFVAFVYQLPNLFFLGAIPSILFFVSGYLPCPKITHRFLEGLGNLTYSSYLLHFPLNISIAIFFTWRKNPIPANDVIFFLSYMIVLLTISRIVYIGFEAPAQNFLRRKMLKKNI